MVAVWPARLRRRVALFGCCNRSGLGGGSGEVSLALLHSSCGMCNIPCCIAAYRHLLLQVREHFHVPLTWNPFGYSTYRGS